MVVLMLNHSKVMYNFSTKELYPGLVIDDEE